MPRPTTYDHLKKKKPMQTTVWIAMDPELAKEQEEAKQNFDVAKLIFESETGNKELAAKLQSAQERLEEVNAKVAEDAASFTFRGIGRRKYEDLLESHPMTPAQQEEYKGQNVNPWNPDTFPPALIEKCLVSPELTRDQVLEIWNSEDWNNAELFLLFNTALFVNSNRRSIELGNGSSGTVTSAES